MNVVQLTILEQVQGLVPPDVDLFRVRGLEENYVGVAKKIVLAYGSPTTKRLGGAWVARLTSPAGKITTLVFTRTSNEEAEIEWDFPEVGAWVLYIEISGVPIPNSPFTLRASYPSEDTLSKYQIIGSLFAGYHDAARDSVRGSLVLYEAAVSKASPDAEFHRQHLTRLLAASPAGDPLVTEVRRVIDRGIVVVLDQAVPIFEVKADGMIVPHNSRMRWPPHGFQATLLERLDEKHRDLVISRTTKFVEGHPRTLTYGSTIITPVVAGHLRVSHLIHVVTVKLKKARTTSELSYEKATYENLKTSLFTALEEAQSNRHITSLVIPNKISKDFFSGLSNRAATVVKSVIDEWVADPRNTHSIKTYYLASRGDTPKPQRRKSRV